MKIWVHLLILSFSVWRAAAWVQGWKEGRKYVYDYSGKFGSGVSDNIVTQLAGRGLKAQLIIRYTAGHLSVKLQDVKLADYNQRLQSVHEELQLNYERPNNPEELKIISQLEKPFYGIFSYEGKIIGSRHTGSADTVFINTQRAILSLFQVIFPSLHSNDKYYIIEESGIGGDCQTSYFIESLPNDFIKNKQVMNITKTYHYDDCSYNAHWFYSSLIGYKCRQCREENFKPMRQVGRISYGIRGNRQDYTIEQIDATGFISFSPFTTNGQTVISITNQTLALVEIEDPAEYYYIPSYPQQIDGLSFVFNMERVSFSGENIKENNALNRVYDTKYVKNRYENFFEGEKDNVAQATQLLQKINHNFEHYHEIAKVTNLLGQVLFTFNYSDFERFFNQNIKFGSKTSPEEKDRRNYILKMLTIVGTNPSILYALDRIRAKDVPEDTVIEMLTVLPIYVKTPSEPLMTEYSNFVKSDYVNSDKNSLLFSAAWEAFGTLVYRACTNDTFNQHPQRKKTFVFQCGQFISDLTERFYAPSTTSNELSVYLRALKNTRSETAYRVIIESVLRTDMYDVYVRAAAIWGLENFLKDDEKREKITQLLFPILVNRNEDYQLRIYAYDILLQSNPNSQFFSSLLMMVNKEENNQVASYIVTSLTSIANTTDPCYENIAKEARHILPYLVHHDYDFDLLRHSTNKIYAFYNEQYGYGRTTQFISLGGNNTILPRGLYLRQALNIGGYTFDFYEMGFIQRNHHQLDSILAAAMQQYNLMKTPKTEEESYLKEPLDISKLYDMNAEIYSRIFNQDVLSTQHIRMPRRSSYITPLDGDKVDIHYTKVMSSAQMELVIPNLIGLPTYLHLFAPVVAKLSGTADYKHDRSAKYHPSSVDLDLELKFVLDIDIQTSILVDTPSLGAYGYELRTDAGIKVPIHGSIELDLIRNEIKTKKIVSEESYDLIYYDTQPSTFTRNNHLIPVKYSDKPVKRQYKFGHNYFGAGLKVELAYDYYWNDYSTYQTFFTTFFHKSSRYEDYYDLADKWYAGSRGFLDYAVLNPTARPFHFRARVERSTTNPTEEVYAHWKRIDTPYNDEEKSTADQAWSSSGATLDIIARGSIERRWTATLEIDRHWPQTNYRRLKFYVQRTPIPNYDDKPFEICLISETRLQGGQEILENPLNPSKEARLEYSAVLNIGESCGSGSRQFLFNVEGSQSEEQRLIDREKLQIYQRCKEDYTKGYEFSLACWKVKKEQGRLDQWILDIVYDDKVNPKIKDFVYRAYSWVRYRMYNNIQIENGINTGIQENRIRMEANFSYYQPIVDINVQRAHEKAHYQRVFVPAFVPHYEPITIVEPFWSRYLKRTTRLQTSMCVLSGDYIVTFDGVKYKYPLEDCYHIAVANCLRENVVLMFRSVVYGKYTKALKLIIDDSTIEIQPQENELVAEADGQNILQEKEHVYINKDKDENIRYGIYRKHQGYIIDSKISGLKIYFDGRNTKIKVSNFYHGLQCGMCGDFNNEKRYEYRAVDGTLYQNGAEFARSYVVQNECQA